MTSPRTAPDRAIRRRRLGRAGTAATEFGLLLPLYLTAAIGVLEIGWQLTVASTLDRSTLRASRFGVTGQNVARGAPNDIQCRSQSIPWLILAASGNILQAERLTVSVGASPSPSRMNEPIVPGAGLGGQVVTYDISYRQPFLSGAWLNLVGAPAEIVHRTTLIVRNEAFANAPC